MAKKIFPILACALVVLLFIFVANGHCFRPGPDVIRECEKCKRPIVEHTTSSGNTFGARVWTDGKMDAPMLPDRPRVGKCPYCGHLFWIEDMRKLGELQLFRTGPKINKTWLRAKSVQELSESEYYRMLREGTYVTEEEKYLRFRAWRAANDKIRYATNPKRYGLSPKAVENLNRLSIYLNEENEHERIMKAEIARELDKFEECRSLLDHSFPEEYTQFASTITSLCKAKDHVLREVTERDGVKRKQTQD